MKDLFNKKNFKSLKRERWRKTLKKKLNGILCSWINTINVVVMTIPSKGTHKFTVINIATPLFTEIESGAGSEIHMEPDNALETQINSEQKDY